MTITTNSIPAITDVATTMTPTMATTATITATTRYADNLQYANYDGYGSDYYDDY